MDEVDDADPWHRSDTAGLERNTGALRSGPATAQAERSSQWVGARGLRARGSLSERQGGGDVQSGDTYRADTAMRSRLTKIVAVKE